jgi:hypothetical protein
MYYKPNYVYTYVLSNKPKLSFAKSFFKDFYDIFFSSTHGNNAN